MLRVFFSMVFVSVVASAECSLDTPIALVHEDLLKGALLNDVNFDEVPKFTRPADYDPAKDSLSLSLFNIEWNDDLTGFLGASVGVMGKLESVGFAQMYEGEGGFEGSTEISGSKTIYRTFKRTDYWGEHHLANEGFYELSTVVQAGELISISLQFPIHSVWKELQLGSIIQFTGEHQTICLKN